MSPMLSKDSQIRHSGINMSIPQGGGPMSMSLLAARHGARDDLIASMQMQHKREREQDQAKIASLEQYID